MVAPADQDVPPFFSNYIEVPSGGSSEEESEGPMSPLSPRSPIPLVDSTSADSPGLVTSTQGSPQVCKVSWRGAEPGWAHAGLQLGRLMGAAWGGCPDLP